MEQQQKWCQQKQENSCVLEPPRYASGSLYHIHGEKVWACLTNDEEHFPVRPLVQVPSRLTPEAEAPSSMPFRPWSDHHRDTGLSPVQTADPQKL